MVQESGSRPKNDLWGQAERMELEDKEINKYLKGHPLTCLLRLIARHEQEITNWKMKTKPRMIMY